MSFVIETYVQGTYLCDGVLLISRVLDEESDQSHEGVQGVETLCPNESRAVVLFSQGAIAEIHAHLG